MDRTNSKHKTGGSSFWNSCNPSTKHPSASSVPPTLIVVLVGGICLFLAIVAGRDRSLEVTQSDLALLRQTNSHCEAKVKKLKESLKKEEKGREKCRLERDFQENARTDLEIKLESALSDKMSALEQKLTLIQEAREAEERLLQALSHVKLLEDEKENKDKLMDAKNEELSLAKEEIEVLKFELVQNTVLKFESKNEHFEM